MLSLFVATVLMGQDRPHTLTGHIDVIPAFESKFLNNKRPVWVYLPPDYAKNLKRRYSVLYMHDGQNVFDGATSFIPGQEWRADEVAESLINSNLIEPIIIVGIANAGMDRGDEYLPTRAKMGAGPAVGGRADLYGRLLIEELKPFIDRTYRTLPDARHTALAGSSFGGIATLYLGLTHPNVFSKLGVVSPSVWWDDRVMLKRVDALPKALPLRIWVDIGRQEGDAVGDAEALRDALIKKGWKLGRDLAYYEEGYAEHNELAWSRRMPALLLFLFGRK